MGTPPAGTVWICNPEQPSCAASARGQMCLPLRVGVSPVAQLGLCQLLQQSVVMGQLRPSLVSLLRAKCLKSLSLCYLLNGNTKWQSK